MKYLVTSATGIVIIQRDIRNCSLDHPSADLENALGRKPTPFYSFINAL